MKRVLMSVMMALALAAQAVLAQAPQAIPKTFSHGVEVTGTGKMTLTYRSLHYNEGAYQGAKRNPQQLTNLNRLWRKIGKLNTEFDMTIAGVAVPKGSYDLGISFDANDNFKLILGGDGKEIEVPLQASLDGPVVNYLSFDVRPENNVEAMLFEGRYGKIRASAPIVITALAGQGTGAAGGHQPNNQ